MSVSAKSPKSVMYPEIERLRFLLEKEERKSQGLEEELRREKAKQKPASKKHPAAINMAALGKAYCAEHGVKVVGKAELLAYANSKAAA